jgi:UTP--glucose-1-phosphate uridylyltransferase
LYFAYQKSARGIPDVIYVAKEFIGHEPFILAMPDVIFFGRSPSTSQLLKRSVELEGNIGGYAAIPSSRLHTFGYGKETLFKKISKDVFEVLAFRKQVKNTRGNADQSSSFLRGCGRTILLPRVFGYINKFMRNREEELSDVELYDDMILAGERFFAVRLYGTLFDAGNPLGFCAANTFVQKFYNSKERRLLYGNTVDSLTSLETEVSHF